MISAHQYGFLFNIFNIRIVVDVSIRMIRIFLYHSIMLCFYMFYLQKRSHRIVGKFVYIKISKLNEQIIHFHRFFVCSKKISDPLLSEIFIRNKKKRKLDFFDLILLIIVVFYNLFKELICTLEIHSTPYECIKESITQIWIMCCCCCSKWGNSIDLRIYNLFK